MNYNDLRYIMKQLLKITLLLFLIPALCKAQTRTVGLQIHKKGTLENGYIMFSPLQSTTTYLIDRCGKLVHNWESKYSPALSTYFLPDGTLLKTGNDVDNIDFNVGGHGGYIQKLSWTSKVLWSCKISDSKQCLHHDICPMANGHILAIVYVLKTDVECTQAGREKKYLTSGLWSEKIIEIVPKDSINYDIVWEWNVWDHLVQNADSAHDNFGVVSKHPELININFIGPGPVNPDWLHMNAVAYNANLDQIVLSNHNFSEIWIIDHSTTTAQAADHKGGKRGKGGDLLYRWGNPQAYDNGKASDQKLFQQHNAHWIEDKYPNAGKIILFNNGLGRPEGAYSSVEIINPPLITKSGTYTQTLPYLPVKQDRIYKDSTPTKLYSPFISGAQCLSNGNLLLCSGQQGLFEEIDGTDHKLWSYINPVLASPVEQGQVGGGAVFRCTYYPVSYSGFAADTPLIAGDPIELKSPKYDCFIPALPVSSGIDPFNKTDDFSINNPVTDRIIIHPQAESKNVSMVLYDILGHKVQAWAGLQLEQGYTRSLDIDKPLQKGIYFLYIINKEGNTSIKLIKE